MVHNAGPPLLGLIFLATAATGVGWAATQESGPAISPPPERPLFEAAAKAPPPAPPRR